MRLMSERHQMSDGECKVLEGLFRDDINSPIISEGDESSSNEDNEEVEVTEIKVTVENNGEQEKDHVKYSGSHEVMIELSEALQSFKASPWEETMDWYQYDDYKFFGQVALNDDEAVDKEILFKRKKKWL